MLNFVKYFSYIDWYVHLWFFFLACQYDGLISILRLIFKYCNRFAALIWIQFDHDVKFIFFMFLRSSYLLLRILVDIFMIIFSLLFSSFFSLHCFHLNFGVRITSTYKTIGKCHCVFSFLEEILQNHCYLLNIWCNFHLNPSERRDF